MSKLFSHCVLGAFVLFSAGLIAGSTRWSEAEVSGFVTHEKLDEISGLAASKNFPGEYFTLNDGGNPASLQRISESGQYLADYAVPGVINQDWEDLASFELSGKPYLLIADVGDNGGIRDSGRLHVLEEPGPEQQSGELTVAWSIEFRWPDGARDCEAVAVDARRGEILLVSKKRVPAELWRLPLQPGSPERQTAELVGTLGGIEQPDQQQLALNPRYGRYRAQITAADLSPNGRVLAVLNYHAVYFYVRPGQDAWTHEQLQRGLRLDFPWMPQAEALAFSADSQRLLIASEQRPSPVLRFSITN